MKKTFGWQLSLLLVVSLCPIGPIAAVVAQEDQNLPPGYQTFALRHVRAIEVAPQLQKLLNDLGTNQKVLVDGSSNALLVGGREASTGLTQQLVQALDRPASAAPETAPTPELGPRVAVDPSGKPKLETPRPPAEPAPQAAHSLRHVSWQELEDSLARFWGSRLLRGVSRDGEVATIHAQHADGTQPVMVIDRRTDSVRFLGSSANAKNWAQIVRMLDQPATGDSQQTQMVPVEHADPQQIRQTVTMMQQLANEEEPGDVEQVSMLFQPQDQPAQPPAAQPPADQPPTPPADAPTADDIDVGGVLGPVQIEFVEGLDVIVLRGNRRDVERLQRIIQDIERLSQETLPLIEIHRLRFVGSQVMAQLVTEIYNEILSPRQGVVTIRPLVKPNSLLLIGRTDSVKLVKDLVVKLDQPVSAESQFEVFQLEHISVLDAQETIEAFFVDRFTQIQVGQAQTLRPGLGTRVNVVADYRSNQLIVQASARDMDEVRQLIARIDVESSGATNELKIFRLKNTLASDVAPVLQDALNWQLIGNRAPLGATATGVIGVGIGQAEERSRLRSAVLTFMAVDSEGGQLLESGLLSDVRVTADVAGNALLVTGPSKSMGLIAALIRELDTLPAARAQIKVFEIINGDATALATTLQQLLGQTAQVGQQFGVGTALPFLTPGLQAAVTGEGTLLPVRFGVDQRSNSIIATGSESDLGVVEAILLRLDEHSMRDQQTVVYWLANAPATDVATAVNNWLSQRTQLFQQQVQISPESPTIRINREIIVVAETISNSIIISAAPELIEEIKRVVESLDRRPPLVKIDVLIAEVALTDFFEFGAEYGIQDGLLFDRQTAAGDPVGYNFNNQPLGATGPAGSNVLGQGLSSLGLGRVSSERGYGGLVLSASSNSVSVLIRALQEQGRLQILSRPTITTLDSQPASINVGARVSRLAGTSIGVNVSQQDVIDVDTGIILGVTPRVTPEGFIVMEIDATKSALSETEGVNLPAGDGATFFQPNIDEIVASTTVSARDGQTVVFAGLIETTKADVRRGIPWLSDLPVVGPMFAFRTKTERRSELMIILTPKVIYSNDEQEIDWIKYTETERMSWCLADVAKMFDITGMTTRPGSWCGCPDMCVCPDVMTIYPHLQPTGMPTPMGHYPESSETIEFPPTPSLAPPVDAGAQLAPTSMVAPATYSPPDSSYYQAMLPHPGNYQATRSGIGQPPQQPRPPQQHQPQYPAPAGPAAAVYMPAAHPQQATDGYHHAAASYSRPTPLPPTHDAPHPGGPHHVRQD